MKRPRIGLSNIPYRWAASIIVPIVAIAMTGGSLAIGQEKALPIRAAQPEENITLDVPAGVDLKVTGKDLRIPSKPNHRQIEIFGGATLAWGNGFKLTVRDARVVVMSAGNRGPTRVFIRPQADEAREGNP